MKRYSNENNVIECVAPDTKQDFHDIDELSIDEIQDGAELSFKNCELVMINGPLGKNIKLNFHGDTTVVINCVVAMNGPVRILSGGNAVVSFNNDIGKFATLFAIGDSKMYINGDCDPSVEVKGKKDNIIGLPELAPAPTAKETRSTETAAFVMEGVNTNNVDTYVNMADLQGYHTGLHVRGSTVVGGKRTVIMGGHTPSGPSVGALYEGGVIVGGETFVNMGDDGYDKTPTFSNNNAVDYQAEERQREVERQRRDVEAKRREEEAKRREIEAKRREEEAKRREVERQQKAAEKPANKGQYKAAVVLEDSVAEDLTIHAGMPKGDYNCGVDVQGTLINPKISVDSKALAEASHTNTGHKKLVGVRVQNLVGSRRAPANQTNDLLRKAEQELKEAEKAQVTVDTTAQVLEQVEKTGKIELSNFKVPEGERLQLSKRGNSTAINFGPGCQITDTTYQGSNFS